MARQEAPLESPPGTSPKETNYPDVCPLGASSVGAGMPNRPRKGGLYEGYSGCDGLWGLSLPQAGTRANESGWESKETTSRAVEVPSHSSRRLQEDTSTEPRNGILHTPLDIYLNKRLADFEARLEATGKGQLIRNVCAAIARRLKNRRDRHRAARQDLDERQASNGSVDGSPKGRQTKHCTETGPAAANTTGPPPIRPYSEEAASQQTNRTSRRKRYKNTTP